MFSKLPVEHVNCNQIVETTLVKVSALALASMLVCLFFQAAVPPAEQEFQCTLWFDLTMNQKSAMLFYIR